jgi:uncharacterized protein YcfL
MLKAILGDNKNIGYFCELVLDNNKVISQQQADKILIHEGKGTGRTLVTLMNKLHRIITVNYVDEIQDIRQGKE